MNIYEFRVITREQHDLSEELETRVYEAGCGDAVLGLGRLDFDREADSLVDAVASAIRDVRAAGLTVSGVEVDDVSVSADVADALLRLVPDSSERERLLEALAHQSS